MTKPQVCIQIIITVALFFANGTVAGQTFQVPESRIPNESPFRANVPPYEFPQKPKESAEFKAMDKYMEMEFILLNDSVIYTFTVIKTRDSIYSAFVGPTESRVRIFPSDTKEVRCYDGGDVFVGIAADSCWLFKSVTGKINAYSSLPGSKSPLTDIQYGDGPISPFTQENLFRFVADDPEAKKIAETRLWWNALRIYNKNKKVADRKRK